MKLEPQMTEDGSSTLFVPSMNEHYHSTHGAVNEALHVYIHAALNACNKTTLSVFEVGFGTGLNAFLTALEAQKRNLHISYHGIDNFKIPEDLFQHINYDALYPQTEVTLGQIHHTTWDKEEVLSAHFSLHKIDASLQNYKHTAKYDVVYFDAFAPNKQEELWTATQFERLYMQMNLNAILTTYCAKGAVRRMLEDTGFAVERIAGPQGKREMLRAIKLQE